MNYGGRTIMVMFGEQSEGFEAIKVKCTFVQALRLCTDSTAQRGSRGIALPFLDHGTRSGWGFSVTPQPLFTPGKDLVPIVQGAGWAPGPVWTGAENLSPTGIRSPDRPARSQSLYRLRYPAFEVINSIKIIGSRTTIGGFTSVSSLSICDI